jgi:hypothetical protein
VYPQKKDGTPDSMMKERDLETGPPHFDTPVSCYRNVYAKEAVTTTMWNWLRSTKWPRTEKELARMEQVLQYRLHPDGELKKQLPIFTPGALMNHRDKAITDPPQLQVVTGWMQFDVDAKDNQHLGDAAHLRDEISKIVYVAYCAVSTSGNGVWGLVKVKHPDCYREHFEQLKKDFASVGITLDPSKGGNPTDPRFCTFDPDAYFASEFKVYDRKGGTELSVLTDRTIEPHQFHGGVTWSNQTATWSRVADAVAEITQRGLDIAPDYNTYMKIGMAFAHEFGDSGREFFHVVCRPSPKYKQKDADRQFTACLQSGKGGITIGTFFHFYRLAMGG